MAASNDSSTNIDELANDMLLSKYKNLYIDQKNQKSTLES